MRHARSGHWNALAVAVAVAVVVVLTGCAREAAQSAGDESVATPTDPVVVPTGPIVAPTLILGRDGLGVAAFGDKADETVAAVTAVLGEPDNDSGWVDPLSIGACAGEQARFVAWGSLYLYFSDESAFGHGEPHFFGYSYGSESDLEAIPEGLATTEGIGLGTTVAFLRAAYHDVVVEAGEEGLFPSNFYVDANLSGRLTGGNDDDLVTVIIGGDPCGVGM
jgi:hypothetical protein